MAGFWASLTADWLASLASDHVAGRSSALCWRSAAIIAWKMSNRAEATPNEDQIDRDAPFRHRPFARYVAHGLAAEGVGAVTISQDPAWRKVYLQHLRLHNELYSFRRDVALKIFDAEIDAAVQRKLDEARGARPAGPRRRRSPAASRRPHSSRCRVAAGIEPAAKRGANTSTRFSGYWKPGFGRATAIAVIPSSRKIGSPEARAARARAPQRTPHPPPCSRPARS